MSRDNRLAGAIGVSLGIAAAVVGGMAPAPAGAQVVYQCPPGYYYYPDYGCVPQTYFYGPPYYAYPDFGFGFFYGGPRDGYPGRAEPPRGGAPRGGGGHGGGHDEHR